MKCFHVLVSGLALIHGASAAALEARQAATSTSSALSGVPAATSTANAGSSQTTIDGKGSSNQGAAPNGEASATGNLVGGQELSSTHAGHMTATGTDFASMLRCRKPDGSPICLPANETLMHVDDTYFVTWDPTRFPINTTISILLNYANDSDHGNRVAWTSAGTPREKGFVTIKMDDAWRIGTPNATLDFALVAYGPLSGHTAEPMGGPTIFLNKVHPHYPPSPKSKMPDQTSLLIGVPLGVGALLFVLVGLYCGMRKHRKIDVKAILEKRRGGYGTRKSKRQRLGIKRGAIRLEEVKAFEDGPFSDAHGNAFRHELDRQRTGRH